MVQSATESSVLVVDDSDDLASILVAMIESQSDLSCVGRLSSADRLLEEVNAKKPSIVVLDLTMPGRNPLDAMAETASACPESRFIVLSGYDDPDRIDEAVDHGAWGFVSKNGDFEQLVAAIRTVSRGQFFSG